MAICTLEQAMGIILWWIATEMAAEMVTACQRVQMALAIVRKVMPSFAKMAIGRLRFATKRLANWPNLLQTMQLSQQHNALPRHRAHANRERRAFA